MRELKESLPKIAFLSDFTPFSKTSFFYLNRFDIMILIKKLLYLPSKLIAVPVLWGPSAKFIPGIASLKLCVDKPSKRSMCGLGNSGAEIKVQYFNINIHEISHDTLESNRGCGIN
jgi:hypothetical protein